MNIKETIENVLHANENAKLRKEAEERARRNAIMGCTGVAATGVVSIVLSHSWRKRFEKLSLGKEEALMNRITELEERISALEPASVKTSFEEVDKND